MNTLQEGHLIWFHFQKYTAEERRVIEGRQTDSAFIPQRMVPWLPRSVFVLSPEQALMNESRPPGSLEKASRLAKVFYPLHQIVTTFQEVPPEPFFPWDTFLMQNRRCVLVAFINKYQEHVMRHGVYIKVSNVDKPHISGAVSIKPFYRIS